MLKLPQRTLPPFSLLPRIGLQSGFTLIEILIAITIFSIGILAVVSMQSTSIGGNSAAQQITEKTSWASDQIEQMMAMSYADIDDGTGTNNGSAGLDDGGITPSTVSDGGPVSSPDGNYKIYWNVAEDDPIANLKSIRIIVTQSHAATPPITIDYVKANEF